MIPSTIGLYDSIFANNLAKSSPSTTFDEVEMGDLQKIIADFSSLAQSKRLV